MGCLYRISFCEKDTHIGVHIYPLLSLHAEWTRVHSNLSNGMDTLMNESDMGGSEEGTNE